jgi:hypothetical protein
MPEYGNGKAIVIFEFYKDNGFDRLCNTLLKKGGSQRRFPVL